MSSLEKGRKNYIAAALAKKSEKHSPTLPSFGMHCGFGALNSGGGPQVYQCLHNCNVFSPVTCK